MTGDTHAFLLMIAEALTSNIRPILQFRSALPTAMRPSFPHIRRARIEHRFNDRDIACAAAEIAGENVARAVGVAVGLFSKHGGGCVNLPSHQEAILQGVMLPERPLGGGEAPLEGKT